MSKIGVFLLVVLVFGFVGQGFTEQPFSEKEAAMATLEKLANIPDQLGIVNQAQNAIIKERVATIMIDQFAGQVKYQSVNFKGKVTYKDILRAATILDSYTAVFADKKCGNSDGVCSPEEFTKFQNTIMKSPGFRILHNLMIDSALAKTN